MIHDQHVGTEDAFAGLKVEAIRVIRALPAQAIGTVALNQIPHRFKGLDWQVGFAAVGGLTRPAADLDELVDPAVGIEERVRLRLHDTEPAEAEVVPAALHKYRPEVAGMTDWRKGMSFRINCSCRLIV